MATQPLSLLSGEEIESNGLVIDSIDKNLYRASTYDLSVGDIIPSEEDEARLESNGSKFALLPGAWFESYRRSLYGCLIRLRRMCY
jgi:hypothetical protein